MSLAVRCISCQGQFTLAVFKLSIYILYFLIYSNETFVFQTDIAKESIDEDVKFFHSRCTEKRFQDCDDSMYKLRYKDWKTWEDELSVTFSKFNKANVGIDEL